MTATRVFITGHAGYVGRHLVTLLRAQREHVRLAGYARRPAPEVDVDMAYVGDVTDPGTLAAALEDFTPEIVVHLAAALPPTPDAALWTANVGGAAHLLAAARELKQPPRIVLCGSAAEYGNTGLARVAEDAACRPLTTYGHSKLAATHLAQFEAAGGVRVCVARPFNLLGPGMGLGTMVGALCAQLVAPDTVDDSVRPVRLGSLAAVRDFLDVRDVAAALWCLAQHGVAGMVYNICSGAGVPLREIVARAMAWLGRPREILFDSTRLQDGDAEASCGDPARLTMLTAWRPRYTLDQSLCDTLRWFSEAVAGEQLYGSKPASAATA